MALSREEMLADLRKARIHKYVYLGASIGLVLLAAALVVAFFVRVPKHDVAAVILAAVGLFFSVLMAHQSVKTGRIEKMIAERLAAAEEDVPGGARAENGGGEGAPDSPGLPPVNGKGSGPDEP